MTELGGSIDEDRKRQIEQRIAEIDNLIADLTLKIRNSGVAVGTTISFSIEVN